MIGRGGMAEVFAGVDRRLGRPVAIKLLLPAMAARPDIRSRFEAEARAAASLSHPNAVAVFDTGEHDGVPYIVMERLGGETLGDRMTDGPVDPDWLITVAIEVLGALAAAHAVGLIHRDVKPGNILLAADGRAKVADFGIAKSLESDGDVDLTTTGQLLGTPAYLAPERLDGTAASPRSDLWALGVVLYEALAGFKPFGGTTPLAVAGAVTAGAHRPLSEVRPDLDPALVSCVERAMAHDPSARFASAGEMAGALTAPAPGAAALAETVNMAGPVPGPGAGPGLDGTQVLEGAAAHDPLVAPVPPPPPPPGLSGDRLRRVLIGAVLAGLAILVIVLVVRAGSGTKTPTVAGGASTTTAAQATTTAATTGLAQQLRDTASKLGSGDGPLAADLASRLRALADQVQKGGGGPDATALLATTVGWARAGQITAATAATTVSLLAQVPGIDQSVLRALTAPATTAAPAPSPTPAPTRPPGKGKKGKG
ncbi:MAG: eukaryotic-like serine/threonine-protein kinase [Acidimicrobiaceae bacterium]